MITHLHLLQKIAIWAIPLLLAITLHEVAHGWFAYCFGDDTAKRAGRLTLNPLAHLDLIGTVLVPLVLLAVGNTIFGWAKPVPVRFERLQHPRRDMALVALAGPMANFLMAVCWAMLAKGLRYLPLAGSGYAILTLMAEAGIFINLILLVLNLMPIPPLDGSRVITSLVSPSSAARLARLEIYGFFIIVLLIYSGLLIALMAPIVRLFARLVYYLVGI